MPPIWARLADGRTSNIPPIGTLPFTRKMDKPSSISSNSCTTLSKSVCGTSSSMADFPIEEVQ